MGRKKKVLPVEEGKPINFLSLDDFTGRDKDAILMVFHRIKIMSSNVSDDNKIKELIFLLDEYNLTLARK